MEEEDLVRRRDEDDAMQISLLRWTSQALRWYLELGLGTMGAFLALSE